MTPQERAEKIVSDWNIDDGVALLERTIAAQIDEARQAMLAELLKLNDQTSKDCYGEGFRAAREKAKGKVIKFRDADRYEKGHGFMTDLDSIAQRIGEMEP